VFRPSRPRRPIASAPAAFENCRRPASVTPLDQLDQLDRVINHAINNGINATCARRAIRLFMLVFTLDAGPYQHVVESREEEAPQGPNEAHQIARQRGGRASVGQQ
jgi:hypothetical protein